MAPDPLARRETAERAVARKIALLLRLVQAPADRHELRAAVTRRGGEQISERQLRSDLADLRAGLALAGCEEAWIEETPPSDGRRRVYGVSPYALLGEAGRRALAIVGAMEADDPVPGIRACAPGPLAAARFAAWDDRIAGIVATIEEARRQGCQLLVSYETLGGLARTLRVSPAQLFLNEGVPALLARVDPDEKIGPDDPDMYVFALDRVDSARLSAKPALPALPRPAIEVTLRVSPRIAAALRGRARLGAQRVGDADPDGWTAVTGTVHSMLEIVRLVLAWGGEAEVVQPADARAAVARRVAALAALHPAD